MLGIFSPRPWIVPFKSVFSWATEWIWYSRCPEAGSVSQILVSWVINFLKSFHRQWFCYWALDLGVEDWMKGLSLHRLWSQPIYYKQWLPAHEMKAAIQSQEIICYYPDSLNLALQPWHRSQFHGTVDCFYNNTAENTTAIGAHWKAPGRNCLQSLPGDQLLTPERQHCSSF